MTFTVNTTADDGAGSLRDAITQANASPGADVINFDIGINTPTILVGSTLSLPLPTITEAVTINGATGGATRVELNGTQAGAAANGLTITASNCQILALVINRFSGNGISITGGGGNVVQGSFIGTNAAGGAMLNNTLSGVLIDGSSNNTIGGTTSAARNVISGNDGNGVQIRNAGASNNTVQGNFIGTDVTGAVGLTNASGGVLVLPGATFAQIGGAAATSGNLISGNGGFGVRFETANSMITNNLIGTTADGLNPLPNGNGIEMGNHAVNNLVGGTSGRNIISGNDSIGVLIGDTSAENTIQGNFIGTDITGTVALGNASAGVVINSDASDNLIGGSIGNGPGNVISGNSGGGIVINSSTGNLVQGNLIGTDVNGTAALGNNSNGVSVGSTTQNNSIGGIDPGAGNTIAFNNGIGVGIVAGSQNSVLSNSIFSNAGLGINLSDDSSVQPNDACDDDTGANNLQNFPDLTSATSMGASTAVVGSLNSTASTQFRIEFFSNAVCDASGNGEGAVFIGSTVVTTDPTCIAPINVNLPVTVPAGQVITATATDLQGNTSEFSQCVTVAAVDADLSITSNLDSPDPVVAGANITYTISFANNGPNPAQTVTVTNAVPVNTTFVSATVTTGAGWSKAEPSVGGTGNVIFSKATVASGETAVFTVVVNVNANTPDATVITDNAVAASATNDPVPGNNTGTAMTAVLGIADLGVTKTDSPDPVGAGNNITYTINFVNNGPGEAQTVTVTDTVPANTTFVSAVVSTGSGWGVVAPGVGLAGNVVFSKGIVASGESAVFTIVVNVNPGTAAGTLITNNAVGASTTADPTMSNNTGTATTTVQAQSDLAVTKTDSPDPVIAGNNITYTVNFANNGPSIAANVTVTDSVPANATFVSAMVTIGAGWGVTAPAVGSTGNIVFSKASVPNEETAVFTIVVRVNSNTPSGTIITNSATAATASADSNPANNIGTATTTVETQADVGIIKTGLPSPVSTGSNLAYTIGVTNAGPSDAVGVTVGDEVPPDTTFVSVTPSQGTFTAPPPGGTGAVTCSLGAIASGGSASITLIVRVNAAPGSNITNTASVTANSTDPVPGNNSSTVMTPVVFSPCSLNCPADVSANTLPLPFGCGALVGYPQPSTVGPCAGVTCTPPSNTFFPVGATPVICTADGGASCSFNVTVKDTTAPRITCSGNITTSAPPGQNSVVVKYASPPIVVDNCSGGTAICTPPSGATFPVGTSMVTCTASDAAENTSTCSFSVTVTDAQAPTITCPSPVAVDIPASQCAAVVTYPPPTVTDNAPGTIATCAPPSGSTFPAGVTTVNCAAVDISGNRTTCAFAVTVRRPGNVQTPTVTFGGQTPVPPVRKAKKNPPASCDCSKTFTIPNNGCGVLGLSVSSISRTGSDVTSGKITDPDDSKFFSLRVVNPDGSESPAFRDLCPGFCIEIEPGQSQTFRVVFSPVIPRPSGKTTGLAASEVLPNTVTSKITFSTNAGGPLTVDLIAHVGTALQLINAAKPKKAATASFTRSGDEFILTYSVFDSNLDTTRARYELLDQGGAVVGQAIEVDLIQPIIEGRVSKGQSFVVEQRFPGAGNQPGVTSLRLTVFDAESNDSLTTQLGSSANAAAVGASGLAKPVALKPRAVRLSGSRP
ncbi:MAG: HYR domain-containing protein [Acidobacteriota bacterium]